MAGSIFLTVHFNRFFAAGFSLLCIILIPKGYKGLITAVVIAGKFFITMSFGIIFFYTNELFPTVIRATGMGTSGMMGR